MKKSSHRKHGSGRVAEQLSPSEYRKAPFALQIVIAVFGTKAVNPDFRSVLEMIVWKLESIAEKNRERRNHEDEIRSTLEWIGRSNPNRGDQAADAEIDEDVREAINEHYKLLSENEERGKIREEPPGFRFIVSRSSAPFESFDQLSEFEKDILRKLDPEVFTDGHWYHRIATSTRTLLEVNANHPEESSLLRAQQMILKEGGQWADPIRLWVLIAYRSFFERNRRPPTGIEMVEEYRNTVCRFPDRRYPVKDDDISYHGEDNLRKIYGQLGLWMINEKFAKAIDSAKKFPGMPISGNSLLKKVSQKIQKAESLDDWAIHDFSNRLQWITKSYEGDGIEVHPLFEVYSRFDPSVNGLRIFLAAEIAKISKLGPSIREGHNGAPEEPGRGSLGGVQLQIFESLVGTLYHLMVSYPGSDRSVMEEKVSVLFRKNPMFKKMVDHCFNRIVEQIASTRPAR